MTPRPAGRPLVLWLAACLLMPAVVRPVAAQSCGAGGCGAGGCAGGVGALMHCPKTTFCKPIAPCIKWKCVCPKPICDPCNLPHAGYYPTCWRPWMYPMDFNHCPVPPPSVVVAPYCCNPPDTLGGVNETLPTPRQLTAPNNSGPEVRP
jgi:hypothetical protein